jgi:hypothetical protein
MDFDVGESKVEPLQQAEMAEIKVIALDVFERNDAVCSGKLLPNHFVLDRAT